MTTPQQSNLHKRLHDEFGSDVLKCEILGERGGESGQMEKSFAFYHALQHKGLTPISLKLKTNMKGQKVDNIIQRAGKQLMYKSINQIWGNIKHLKNLKADCDEGLFNENIKLKTFKTEIWVKFPSLWQ